MISTDTFFWVPKDRFWANINAFNLEMKNELAEKDFVFYLTGTDAAKLGKEPINELFTIGLYRKGLPELYFKNISDDPHVYGEMASIAEMLVEHLTEDGDVLTVVDLPERIKEILDGVEYEVTVMDSEKFFYGIGTPLRLYVDGNYKYINVLQCTRSVTPCRISSKEHTARSITI